MNKKKAFTLAEVLITLTIIGVVAALTIPAIIRNSDRLEYVSALKKIYSALSQSTFSVMNEQGGGVDTWNLANFSDANTNKIIGYYLPHLNNLKTCMSSDSTCNYPDPLLNINGSVSSYYSSFGAGELGSYTYRGTLSDGTYISFNEYSTRAEMMTYWGVDPGYSNGSAYGAFIVDLNGRKRPNQFGRDVFAFVLTTKGLVPAGNDDNSANCSTSTMNGYGGEDCASKVLKEGAENY